MSDLHFDRHQFDGRRALPVSTASRIAFEDYTRMSVHTRKPALKRSIPAFALNDEMLAAVIRRRWQLRRRAYLKPDTDEAIKHKKAVRRAGSYMAMIAAIAYRRRFVLCGILPLLGSTSRAIYELSFQGRESFG
jgi:hypothetical protein